MSFILTKEYERINTFNETDGYENLAIEFDSVQNDDFDNENLLDQEQSFDYRTSQVRFVSNRVRTNSYYPIIHYIPINFSQENAANRRSFLDYNSIYDGRYNYLRIPAIPASNNNFLRENR